jgi:hypothetical protein
MLRSLRIPLFAGFVALAFTACGGGSSTPPDPDGGGQTDGPRVQFDGPKTDGNNPQDDGGTGSDGGTGACIPTGGQIVGAVCTNAKPCTCPADCVNPFKEANPTSKVTGGCWNQPSTEGCGTGEAPIQFSSTDPGHCYPEAPITGTFTIPIGTMQTAGGTINITVNINGANASFTTAAKGWAEHDTTTDPANPEWVLNFYNDPVAAGTNFFLTIWLADSIYNTTTPVSLDGTATNAAWGRLETAVVTGSAFTSDTINAFTWSGTMPLTAAPTTTGDVVGSFNTATMFGFTAEMCGPNSTAC